MAYRLLFVCIENANRSQMAEAFARMHGGAAVEAYSAGSQPRGSVNPRAIAAMADVDYDLSTHTSKSLADIPDDVYDAVVTMGCGDACPDVRARYRADWSVPDPRDLPPEEFGVVRDFVETSVLQLLKRLVNSAGDQRMIPYFVVNAFTNSTFGGNPAGVCLLEEWLDDATMQRVATQNRLSETAFVVKDADAYALRWFTPGNEVDLCGHATLATAATLFEEREQGVQQLAFETRSGRLTVDRDHGTGRLVMDFPSLPGTACTPPPALVRGLGATPVHTFKSQSKYLAIVDTAQDVLGVEPDFDAIAQLDVPGLIVSAPGDGQVDFVSRYFAPRAGVPEDPVTGSAHCTLIPYWAGRLGKTTLHARQVSARGGELFCEYRGERCTIAGHAVTYLRGTLDLATVPVLA